jgi:hypothetical protein
MFQYVGTFAGLAPDDIAGIQAIYGASPPDPMGQSFATATPLTLDSTGAATVSARLSSVSDMDYYQVTTPASGFDGTMSVSVGRGKGDVARYYESKKLIIELRPLCSPANWSTSDA